MRAPRPVEPRRTIVGAREGRRGAFEHANGLGVPGVPVRPPADLPRRALRVVPGRELLVHLAERPLRAVVVALQDVVGREVVQRFLGPALLRELGDDAPDDAEVFVVAAEVARRDRVEEERFALARALVEIRPDPVAGVARALQEVVALGEAQLDDLAVVVPRRLAQAFERRARLRVTLGAEQPLGASQLQPEAVRAGRDRGDRQALELAARERRQVAEREFVDQARVRLGRLVGVADRPGGAAEAHQHVVGRGRLGLRELLVDPHRGAEIVERLVALGLAQRGRLEQVADRGFRGERLKGLARVRGAAEPQLGEALVVLGVVPQRALPHRGLHEDRQRPGEIRVDLELDAGRELVERGGARGAARCGREPELRQLAGQPRVAGRLQRHVARGRRLLRPRRRGRREHHGDQREPQKLVYFHCYVLTSRF